jgi:hypothetical protein
MGGMVLYFYMSRREEKKKLKEEANSFVFTID